MANLEIFAGKPIIRCMKIKVQKLLRVRKSVTVEESMEDYPDLEPGEIRSSTAYARAVDR